MSGGANRTPYRGLPLARLTIRRTQGRGLEVMSERQRISASAYWYYTTSINLAQPHKTTFSIYLSGSPLALCSSVDSESLLPSRRTIYRASASRDASVMCCCIALMIDTVDGSLIRSRSDSRAGFLDIFTPLLGHRVRNPLKGATAFPPSVWSGRHSVYPSLSSVHHVRRIQLRKVLEP